MTSSPPYSSYDDAQPSGDPPAEALAWAAEVLGSGTAADVRAVRALGGGSHASTHLLQAADPERQAVLRRFPPGDDSAAREEKVLRALDGLDGFAPRLLGVDPHGERCGLPTVLITRLPGRADITPADPDAAAAALGHALARLHALPHARLAGFRDGMTATRSSTGPAAAALDGQLERLAAQPRVLAHFDYWSGNVLWQDGSLSGVIDWDGAGLAPRGFDVGWCRLDLALLHGPDTTTADTFCAAYRDAAGIPPPDVTLWDLYTLARSHRTVETWVPNYAGLGRTDLTGRELRRRHTAWTARCLAAAGRAS
ncbi:aminoglycoside phosphotransferase family protein [Streptomyces bathyalis]|uniref:Aminoglycoside phosphotransferase family protein n=1 Tax=Streptomyces bathyalis TaxID=2710756 RepID=A0A7T1T6F0_9ACTN|nr:aminoglycoside phosphotransferase family protein [Streptomyces bathyalis]QPP07260.1 aminoglycoside phosphotransferase family protein [Streptomyces bathyalis]